jgi:hypothetical protein
MNEPGTQYDHLFSRAVEILSSTGQLSAVEEYISSIDDQDYRDVMLGKIGILLVAQHRCADAMQIVRAIQQPIERADALVAVAREHLKRGERLEAKAALAEAILSAEAIRRSTWETPSILLQISTDLYQLSGTAEALPVLRRAVELAQQGNDFDSAKVLSGGAVLLARWGYREEAISVTSLISQPELRSVTQERIAAVI